MSEPTQEELAEGHLFEFSMRSWGVSRVVGDPTYTQADWTIEPHPVQVRAWNLKGALAKAAELPLSAWFPDEDDGPIDTRLNQERVAGHRDG